MGAYDVRGSNTGVFMRKRIPKPSVAQMKKYLSKWETLGNYVPQENALNKLFHKIIPQNKKIEEVLIKVATLNDFYSTNIFSIYSVAKHIHSLNIDKKLKNGDVTIVSKIQRVCVKRKQKNFYSFASKYCSHHNSKDFPIYDSYVDRVLRYFRSVHRFYQFKNEDLKEYESFKKIILEFRKFYGLESFSLKEIDRYLWLLGKEMFPKSYGKRASSASR